MSSPLSLRAKHCAPSTNAFLSRLVLCASLTPTVKCQASRGAQANLAQSATYPHARMVCAFRMADDPPPTQNTRHPAGARPRVSDLRSTSDLHGSADLSSPIPVCKIPLLVTSVSWFILVAIDRNGKSVDSPYHILCYCLGYIVMRYEL